jgi:hypothetical protein
MSFPKDRSIPGAFLALCASLLLGISQAQAHAQLVVADPAVNGSVAAPATITLQFNETLEARVSSFRLTDVDGKEIAVMPAQRPDNKSLAAKPAAPLASGLYTVSWTAVGGDGHPMKGTYSFTVK